MNIIELVFPIIANALANKKVKKILSEFEKGEETEPSGILTEIENNDKITVEMLQEEYVETGKVKERLEDKAKTNIVGITISISLITGASGILTVLNKKYPFPTLSWIIFSLFVISVVYMLFACVLVIKLLFDENIVYRVDLNNVTLDSNTLRKKYSECIYQNQLMNTIRNNLAYSSYKCIKNALFFLFIILILIALPLNQTNRGEECYITPQKKTYSFMYASSSVERLQECSHDRIENAIITAIDSMEIEKEQYEIGIIDENDSLFIKFSFDGDTVKVLMIEPVTTSNELGN